MFFYVIEIQGILHDTARIYRPDTNTNSMQYYCLLSKPKV